jgi:hypothetical protein
MSDNEKHHGGDDHDEVAVAVITPSGIFPGEDLLQRVRRKAPIASVLDAAAEALKLTNTSDWVARVGERHLHPHKTFKDEGLTCIVDIEWHKPEGGGGA